MKALPVIRIVLAWIAALFGILFVFCAAMIYYDPRLAARQTGWAHPHTPILFFVDMGMLGALALGVGFVGSYLWTKRNKTTTEETLQTQMSLLRTSIQGMAFAAVALVGVLFVVIPLYLAYLGSAGDPLSVAIVTMLNTDYALLWFLRLFLAFTGAGILSVFAWYAAAQIKRETVMYLLVIAAFASVMIAEVIARYLFYGNNAILLIGGGP